MDSTLPCLKYAFICPYMDRRGKESSWLCVGSRPPARLIVLRDCPRIDVARAEWTKAQNAKKDKQ